jgi:tetratricopeptide (TPR) repeat protein/anti-sigma regulatory factor (Ser/Thr protein kinase)
MKKIGETKRKKIIIYYIIAIVFPSIILGILAYRGVKNDQALVEREQSKDFQKSGQKINEDVDAYLKDIESKFIEIQDSSRVPEKIVFSDSVLTALVTKYIAVEGVFYISGKNEVSVLNNNFLYLPKNITGSKREIVSEQVENLLNKGWKLEFRQKKYAKAIEYYRKALPVIADLQGKGEIYNSIARLQKKLGKSEEALKTYEIISDAYSNVYIQGNIPLGMVALLESGILYHDIHEDKYSLEALNSLLFQIKNSRWNINYPTYFNFISKTKELIALIENTGKNEKTLIHKSKIMLDSISILDKKTAYLLAAADVPGLIQIDQPPGSDNFTDRYLINGNERSYFIFLSPMGEHEQLGLIYNQEYILKNVLNTSVQKIADDSVFDWEIVNNYGKVLLDSENKPTGTNPVKVLLSSSIPSWTMKIYPKSGGFFVSFIKTSEGVFFYIFLLIVIILAFGLFFTLFTVNNELRLARMKSNFITTVSHEFKSPLTIIRQMVEMLDSGRVSDDERKQKYYSAMLQESERLSHLIDNILDFSKMEAGLKNFSFKEDNLAVVVEEIVMSFQHHLIDKGFQINLNLPDSIPNSMFDREAIQQVFQNLIDNACKYSGGSKIIDVEMEQVDSEITINIKDFGIGIHKDEQDKIFSQFYRAGDELTQNVKGSGIGLTIVKQIVEAHHGTIKLKSEPGKGSNFQIVLPLKMD